MHLPELIQDLALILIAASVMTLIFMRLRQPVVLGYILAGFLVGPAIQWLPNVLDNNSVKVWAEIGVIFLLFSLGLEFSFKKLLRVGPSASIIVLVEMIVMMSIGYSLGRSFGWQTMDCFFLGGIMAISSTAIIIRAVEELGLKTRGFVKLVFGILIMEDLAAVILLVLLSTIALSRQFSGVQVGIVLFKLAFFLVLWFLLGVFLLPSFLKKVRKNLSEETLLVFALGFCFLMVVASSKAGFSPALGAFIMGSILAETIEGERIEHLVAPLKYLFAAIFFVSVGMMIDPAVLVQYAGPILAITAALMVGKIVAITLGSLVSGQSLRHSVQSGMSLAQIGEFSFIIASLGMSLKVTSDFLYPIAISVSAITAFTTPYLIRAADPVVLFLYKRLPPQWIKALEGFRRDSTTITMTDDWRAMTKKGLVIIAANSVVVIAIFLLVKNYVLPFVESIPALNSWFKLVSLLVAILAASPFLWGIAFARLNDSEEQLWGHTARHLSLLVFEIGRWLFALVLIGLLSVNLVASANLLLFIGLSILLIIVFVFRHLETVYLWMKGHFLGNLTEKERVSKSQDLPPIAPWDSHIVRLEVPSDSHLVGKSLSQSQIRERFGITIALIERGRRMIPAPGRDAMIFPGDHLQVIGTDEQIQKFKVECLSHEREDTDSSSVDYVLKPLVVESHSGLVQKSIRDSGVREATQGLVVGLEKKGQRLLNPDSSVIIEIGDILWIAGSRRELDNFCRLQNGC
ncbi:MAG: hypothetical protein RJB66_1789 [Pseudomonadota bacterium]